MKEPFCPIILWILLAKRDMGKGVRERTLGALCWREFVTQQNRVFWIVTLFYEKIGSLCPVNSQNILRKRERENIEFQ